MKGWWYTVRYDNISGYDVCRFICSDSPCDKTCCMHKVLGRCFDIAGTWRFGDEKDREDLVRVMRWRVKHGEKTAKELARIGIASKMEVL